jgi:two-component system, OmpR family, sensor histidine kinase KdpD
MCAYSRIERPSGRDCGTIETYMPEPSARGKLRIYLGYAAGVGKTYQMLDDAQEMKLAGRDVVIGYFEPHARADTIAKARGLETVPRRKVEYRGARFEEMDTGAILARKPQVCVVDEFPHTNVSGSERGKRWQDVEALLDAGVDVLTTMNIQHLESLNDQVLRISGIQVRETIPDWVVQQAEQVVMVDLTPRALLNRLIRGVVYAPDKAEKALNHFFKESTLVALRELALRQTAHEVEIRQLDLEELPPPMNQGGETLQSVVTGRNERILVHVTADPSSAMVIRRAKRVADYLQGDCFAVAVNAEPRNLSPAEREAVDRHLNFARHLHVEARVLEGEDVAASLVDFARRNGVTQLFLARPKQRGLEAVVRGNLAHQVVQLAREMQVTIVAEREKAR